MDLTNSKKHAGYSSTKIYETDDLYICKGCCNQFADSTKVINISLQVTDYCKVYMTLWEDGPFYDSILKLLETSNRKHRSLLKQSWKIAVSLGKPEELLKEVFEAGRQQGSRDKIAQLKSVLDLY